MIKFINQNNCDIAGGPQYHDIKNKTFKNYYDVLEPVRYHGQLVRWVATNNCFFSNKVFNKTNVLFDKKFARVGGSDQLFFSKLNKKKFIIKWNTKSFITENYDLKREKKKWFFRRNFRYGYSGNLIDKKIYGKISLLIIIMKILYLVSISLFFLLIVSRKNWFKSLFFIFKSYRKICRII